MGSFCHNIKQLEDKNVATEISFMVWSNRMDLVALANVKGEVALHRLTWTRAWSLLPPKEDLSVNSLAWKPDGKVIAVAYSSGDVLLVDIETKAKIYKFNVPGNISFFNWIHKVLPQKPKETLQNEEEENELLKLVFDSGPFLQDAPPISHVEGALNFHAIWSLASFLQAQSDLNLLVIGTKDGFLYMKVFGCWTCLVIDMKKHVGSMCSVENVHATDDLSKIFVTIRDESDNVKVILLNSEIFETHTVELYNVGMRYIKLQEVEAYLERILQCISENWETILLEMDNKLAKYASKVPEGGITADFLDLLMFGIYSSELEEFLLHDLSKKGLEKFAQSVEISYSNIQTFVFRHVVRFSQNTTFHLSDLKGMARFEDRYKPLCLDEQLIEKAMHINGGFMIKAEELRQVIHEAVFNYKAFFRWLYVAQLNALDEPVPSEIQKITQQDVNYISKYLQNFDGYGKADPKENKFSTEKLGQYLVDAPLKITVDKSAMHFAKFLEENECLKNNPLLFTHFTDKSLIQVYNDLKTSLLNVFEKPIEEFQKQITPIHTFNVLNVASRDPSMSCVNISKENVLLAFVNDNHLYLLQVTNPVLDSDDEEGDEDIIEKPNGRCAKFYFKQFLTPDTNACGDDYNLVDVEFYSSSVLSILLQESTKFKPGVILQFSVNTALELLSDIDIEAGIHEQEIPRINGSNLLPKLFKNIEFPPSKIAVSGSRRVSIVLSENKRKVKLFEMEAEEEEDEDAEMSSNIVRESDTSIPD